MVAQQIDRNTFEQHFQGEEMGPGAWDGEHSHHGHGPGHLSPAQGCTEQRGSLA